MNKHVNKNRLPASPVENRKQIEVDGMPPQVAIELLCAPGAKMTARQRKTCWAARSKVYCSTLEAKPVDVVLAAKLRKAKWTQIVKWIRCTEAKGALLEFAFSKVLKERHELAILEVDRNDLAKNTKVQARVIILDKIIAALEIKRSELMTFSDSLRSERERRENFIASLKKLAPSVAAGIAPKLIGVAAAAAA